MKAADSHNMKTLAHQCVFCCHTHKLQAISFCGNYSLAIDEDVTELIVIKFFS